MINPRISAVWSTTKPIAPFSCTPRVQEVHTKPEVVHPTPGLLGLGVFMARNCNTFGGHHGNFKYTEMTQRCTLYPTIHCCRV